jgi:predicted N-acetyltransferase YhbS
VSRYTRPRPITAQDDVTDFDSGEPSLDNWLRRRALTNQATGASRCFITCRENRCVGYYALTVSSVQHADSTRRIGHGMPDPIPVVLLARLAVDAKQQGRGLGRHLLRDAIARTVEVSEIVGVRALLVHALHEQARDFYLRFGFEPSPTHELHMMLLMKDARHVVRQTTGK